MMKIRTHVIAIFLFFIFSSILAVAVTLANSHTERNLFIQQTNGPSVGGITNGMVFSPKNPDIIYLANYKSIDGGEIWTEFEAPDYRGVNVLEVDPKNPDIVYLLSVDMLYKSIDGTKTWEKLGVIAADIGITDIEVSPHDSNVIYAGNSAGGLFKSTEGGQSWMDISHKIKVEVPISRIAFNLEKTNEIFISTGSWYMSSLEKTKTGGNGLFKSSDGGETFEHLKNEFSSFEVQDVDAMGDLVFVTTRHMLDHGNSASRVYKSTDSGKTWKKLLESFRFTHVAINPRNKNHIVVSGGDITPSFFVSYDGGTTWKEIDDEATEPIAYTHDLEIVGDGRVYANDYYRPFMKSMDDGETWKWSSDGMRNSGIQVLEVNPKNRNDVFAGTPDGALHRSYDGGKTWKRSYFGSFDYIPTIDFHPKNPDLFYFGVSAGSGGGDGRHTGRATPHTGFYRTLDGGKTWKQSTDLITVESHGKQIEVYDIFVHYKNPSFMLLGSSRHGIWRSENGGKTWKESNNGILEEGFYWHPLFDYPEEAAEEADCKENALKDRKNNQDCFYYATRTSMSIFLNPHDENEIWYTTLNGIFVSRDFGKTWQWLSDDLKNIHTHYMAFDPLDPNTIYVGTHQGAIGLDGNVITSSRGLLISRDAGKTWSQIDNKLDDEGNPTAPGEGHDIRAIGVDPQNPHFVAVGTKNSFFISEDKGETWREIEFTGQGSEVEDIRIDSSAKLMYLGTQYSGVWRGILDYDPHQAAITEITGVSFPSSSIAKKKFSVVVSVDNIGGKAGSLPVALKIGNYELSKTVSLSGADQSAVTFSPILKKPGTYDVLINGTNYGKIVIKKIARRIKRKKL